VNKNSRQDILDIVKDTGRYQDLHVRENKMKPSIEKTTFIIRNVQCHHCQLSEEMKTKIDIICGQLLRFATSSLIG
jgi:hypothetical protein